LLQTITLFLLQPIFKKILWKDEISDNPLLENLFIMILSIYFTTAIYLIVFFNELHENKLIKLKNRLLNLEERIKSQNEDLMLFGLSATHSLKTPLYVTNSFLNNVKKNLLSPNPDIEKSIAYIKFIKESNKQTEKYAQDLNSYNTVYNIHTNKIKTTIYKELNTIIKNISNGNQNAKIINKASKTSMVLNSQLFEIIAQNLIINALKYNDSKIPEITIYDTIENGKIEIYFQDNGIGINTSFSKKIFQPFTRINDKIDVEGSGLGLSGAKIAAERLNGNLELFESGKNGSVFKLTLYITN
jgi:light-regulated signal transduction histidine kinase (bacteriophytochrome)